jgi:hypothetical protein
MVTVTFPIRARGRPGFHGFTLMGTTKRGLDLQDIGDLLLPPDSEQVLAQKRGGWHVDLDTGLEAFYTVEVVEHLLRDSGPAVGRSGNRRRG